MDWIDYFIVKEQKSHNTYSTSGFFHHTFYFRPFLTKRNYFDRTIQSQNAVKTAGPSFHLIYTISPRIRESFSILRGPENPLSGRPLLIDKMDLIVTTIRVKIVRGITKTSIT